MRTEALDIVLATCRAWPGLSTSDADLAAELVRRGHEVRAIPWNDAPTEDFTGADVVVLRSNWDYHHDLDAFEQWLTQIENSSAELHNPVDLVRAHLDKSYLEGLAAAGLRTPLTMVSRDVDDVAILDWMGDHALDQVVVKPAWGASGVGVDLVRKEDLAGAAQRWRADRGHRPMLVQEFIAEVRSGELALVFFAGQFSHGLLRTPAPHDFRVNSRYGGTMSLARNVEPGVIEFAARVEESLEQRATYARIDVVRDGAGAVVMEVEVNEPALGLDLAPFAAARFADALVG